MIGFPSKVLVIADYDNFRFNEPLNSPIDFVIACGDIQFQVLEDIYELFKKPIFAIKGNHDSQAPFPKFVTDVHFKIVQHRNWLIGGWQGVPIYKGTGPYEWDDLAAMKNLDNFPYVDIFICHAPLPGLTDKKDYAHLGSEAILRYVRDKQPKYVFHGHVHQNMGAMVENSAVISVYGKRIVSLTY